MESFDSVPMAFRSRLTFPFPSLSVFQTVALNGEQLRSFGGGYPPAACGKQITIAYKGKTATATVQDECEFDESFSSS